MRLRSKIYKKLQLSVQEPSEELSPFLFLDGELGKQEDQLIKLSSMLCDS